MRTILLAVAVASVVASAPAVQAEELHFITMADWGGQDTWPYTTEGEKGTAALMAKLAPELNPKFVLGLGDNFYTYGVKSVDDSRFQHTFEDVFDQHALSMPFYFCAGNHDHYGNVTAQVAYTGRSNRWNFPSLWYDFTTPLDGGKSIQIIMIDTVLLTGSIDNADISGPKSPEKAKLADDQWAWLEATLKNSIADFILVAGHFPVYSVCEHGPTPVLVSKLLPMLEHYNVTAYLAGHDHCSEHIWVQGSAVDHHGIGAAHDCDTSTAHEDSIPKDSLRFHWANGKGGFATMNVTSESFVVTYYSDAGSVLYTSPSRRPRPL